jgi:hypothetical protein
MDPKKQIELWYSMLTELFAGGVPNSADWDDSNQIIKVLDFIGKHEAMNHTFLPRSGGLDLLGASKSNEEGLIELNLDNIAHLLKPKTLHFRWPEKSDVNWAYFYLETYEIDFSGVYKSVTGPGEELVEISPGKYIKRDYWDLGEYNGEPLPREARLIGRYEKGNFVTFSKASIYNRTSSTYDGRHDKMGFDVFEKHIKKVAN